MDSSAPVHVPRQLPPSLDTPSSAVHGEARLSSSPTRKTVSTSTSSDPLTLGSDISSVQLKCSSRISRAPPVRLPPSERAHVVVPNTGVRPGSEGRPGGAGGVLGGGRPPHPH